jgi:hypothetical protein
MGASPPELAARADVETAHPLVAAGLPVIPGRRGFHVLVSAERELENRLSVATASVGTRVERVADFTVDLVLATLADIPRDVVVGLVSSVLRHRHDGADILLRSSAARPSRRC